MAKKSILIVATVLVAVRDIFIAGEPVAAGDLVDEAKFDAEEIKLVTRMGAVEEMSEKDYLAYAEQREAEAEEAARLQQEKEDADAAAAAAAAEAAKSGDAGTTPSPP